MTEIRKNNLVGGDMRRGTAIALPGMAIVLLLALALPGLSQSDWIDTAAQLGALSPPEHEEWADLFPPLHAVTESPAGRLVAVGADGAVVVGGADPTQPWTKAVSDANSEPLAIAVEPKSGRLVAVGAKGVVVVSGGDPAQPWTQAVSNTPFTLSAIALEPKSGRLVAVGEGGAVVVSGADPAQSWTPAVSKTDNDLSAIVLEPKSGRLVAVGADGAIVVSGADPAQPWTKAVSNTNSSFYAVVLEPKSGRLVAVGDGGAIVVSGVDPAQPWMEAVSSTDDNLSAIVLEPKSGRLVAVGGGGAIVVSGADPAKPWTKVVGNIDNNLSAVALEPKSGRLVAVGADGAIVVSSADPAQPWKKAVSKTRSNLSAIAVERKSGRLVAVGANSVVVVSGTDPAQPWAPAVGGTGSNLATMAVEPKGGRLVAVGAHGAVVVSGADPAQQWMEAVSNTDNSLSAITLEPKSGRLIAVGEGGAVVVSGADPAQPWRPAVSNTENDLSAVVLEPKSGRLVAVGANGAIVVSGADPALPWTPAISNTDNDLSAIALEPKSGRLVAVGTKGAIAVSGADPTQPWTEAVSNSDFGLSAIVLEPKSGRLVAVGAKGVVVVSGVDPAEPWKTVVSNTGSSLSAIVVEPKSGRLVAVGANGVIVVSGVDPAEPWMQAVSSSGYGLSAIVVEPKSGRLVAVGAWGTVLNSSDGALTWVEDKSNTKQTIRAVVPFEVTGQEPRLIALSRDGTILAERPETRKSAEAATRFRFALQPAGTDNRAQPASATIEWRYPPGSSVDCAGLRYWPKEAAELPPPPQKWTLVASVDGLKVDADGLGYRVTWRPPSFITAGTGILYSLDCKDRKLRISWAQPLPTAQIWIPGALPTIWRQGWDWLGERAAHEIVALAAGAAVFIWIVFALGVFWLAPARLVAWHERMPEPAKLDKTAGWIKEIGFGLISIAIGAVRTVLFALAMRPRSLDAWVAGKADEARTLFSARSTVQERHIALNLPVKIDFKLHNEPWSEVRRLLARASPTAILISGPGGAGKTTLACRIGQRALGSPDDPPLGQQRMLPLLIEADAPDDAAKPDGLFPYLAGLLRPAVNENRRITSRLARALVKTGRVLVILDGLSERSAATRQAFDPQNPDFEILRLIVTSRDRAIPGMPTTIETESIPTGALFDFISRYIEVMEHSGEGNRPTDDGILDACGDLKRLLGDTPCTPLLASMWAREIAAVGGNTRPQGVAALMDSYVRRVLMPAADSNEVLVSRLTKDAAKIAELELGNHYVPGYVTRAAALDVLRVLDPEEPESRFDVLAKSRLLESPSPDSDIVRVAPDPIAEHLVARLRTEELKSDLTQWRAFLAHIRTERSPEGFVAALVACAINEVYGKPIPVLISRQIERLLGERKEDRNIA